MSLLERCIGAVSGGIDAKGVAPILGTIHRRDRGRGAAPPQPHAASIENVLAAIEHLALGAFDLDFGRPHPHGGQRLSGLPALASVTCTLMLQSPTWAGVNAALADEPLTPDQRYW